MEQELRNALAQYEKARQHRDKAQLALVRIEAEQIKYVCSQVNEAGKPKYSNAELRDAAVKELTASTREVAAEAETAYQIAYETLKTLRAIAYMQTAVEV